MKNYVKPGRTLTVPAPYTVTSGNGLKVGSIVGIAAYDALITETVEVDVEGVFDVTKVDSQAWTVGAPIYWDDTAKNFTTTVGANTKVGVAEVAVAGTAGLVIGRVRLSAAF